MILSGEINLRQCFSSTVTEIVMVAADGKSRTMICLALRKLAGWLNTISASRKVSPKWLYLRLAVGVVISTSWDMSRHQSPRICNKIGYVRENGSRHRGAVF
ncbi:hypothetical protein KJB16_002618 [Salmonella enterica]|nr:hypothetical protein [Salmonella enterica]EHN5665074.1 hypothetical protein [Salmonella enterica]